MAKLVYGLNQSLDGYIDHTRFRPELALFRHFIEHIRNLAAIVYGRGMYEIMRYWDEDQPAWEAHEHEYAAVWRNKPKWVVSRTLQSVGPNATLVREDLEAVIQNLKSELPGQIEIAGPNLAGALTRLNLIDEYQLYFHPVVLGSGKPFFSFPPPSLRFLASDRITQNIVRLTYAPAPADTGDRR